MSIENKAAMCMDNDSKEFYFSVIMPVYDHKYFREAVDSIIQQSCGFENTQLILVDDGCAGENANICDEYKKLYPDNVYVIHQECKGPSAARNAGLDLVEGKYVNFCDSDDKISASTFGKVRDFIEEHEDESYVYSVVVRYFGDKKGRIPGSGIFDYGSAIIDLNKDYNVLVSTLSNSFIKAEIAKGLRFDKELRDLAHQQYFLQIAEKKPAIGIVAGCTYHFRQYNGSKKTAPNLSPDFYANAMDHFMKWAYDYYDERHGFVPKFVQYLVMYQLQFRIRLKYIPKGILTFEEEKEYYANLNNIISRTDDVIIAQQKNISQLVKYSAFVRKYHTEGNILVQGSKALVSHGKVIEFDIAKCQMTLMSASMTAEQLMLRGELQLPLNLAQNYKLYITNCSDEYEIKLERECISGRSLSVPTGDFYRYDAVIPLNHKVNHLKFYLEADGVRSHLSGNVKHGGNFPVKGAFRNDFYYSCGWKLLPFRSGEIKILHSKKIKNVLSRVKCILLALKDKKIKKYAVHAGKRFIVRMPQKYILFESYPSYSDNALAVYNYFKEHNLLSEYEFIWYTNERDLADLIKKDGYKAVYDGGGRNRYIYKYHLWRSKAIIWGNRFVSKGREDQLSFNLGHGSCLKSVHGHYDMPRALDNLLIQSEFFENPTRYEHSLNELTTTKALGYPRNDTLVTYHAETKPDWLTASKLIVWYPTWRQHKSGRMMTSSVTIPVIHDQEAAERINACAAKNDVLILLKPHFSQNMSYLNLDSFSNLRIISDAFFKDNNILSYEMLAMSDALLTDYSSVYYDYMLVDKPIGLTWEDFEEYKSREGFSVDTDRICAGGEKIYTADDLCRFIEDVANGKDNLKKERNEIKELTNAYCDGSSTKRVAEWIAAEIEKS